MKTLLIWITVISFSLFLTGCTINPSGIEAEGKVVSPGKAKPSMTQVETKEFTFTSKPEKATYQLGEPVYMTFKLLNNTDKTKRVISDLEPSIGAVSLKIKGNNDKDQIEFIPFVEFDFDENVFAYLKRNESVLSIAPIFFGGKGWTFNKPGTYSVNAFYSAVNEKGELEVTSAPVVQIVISDKESQIISIDNEINSASWEAGKFLLWQAGDHLQKGQEVLSAILSRNPESLMAAYTHSAFAHSFSDNFMDYRKKEVRKADCNRVQEHLSKVGSGVSEYVLVQNAMSSLRCAAREEDAKRVDQSFQTISRITNGKQEYSAILERAAELSGRKNK